MTRAQNYRQRQPGPRELAAAAVGISPRLVDFAKKVKSNGIPELLAAVTAGTISVSRAAKIADAPADQQAKLMAAPRRKRDASAATQIRSQSNRLITALHGSEFAEAITAARSLAASVDWLISNLLEMEREAWRE